MDDPSILFGKIVSQYSSLLSPIAVDSVLRVIDPLIATNVDLKDIRLVKKIGGTIDDTHLVDGMVLTQTALKCNIYTSFITLLNSKLNIHFKFLYHSLDQFNLILSTW